MGTLNSTFSAQDVDTLIEAVGDWEQLGMGEYHMLQMVRQIPNLPEDHEAHEYVKHLKEQFENRRQEIEATRRTRQERSVFLKAKLMLIRQDMTVDQIFEMATDSSTVAAPAPKEAPVKRAAPATEQLTGDAALLRHLRIAEFFIKDLGVQSHYEAFVKEHADDPQFDEPAAESESTEPTG